MQPRTVTIDFQRKRVATGAADATVKLWDAVTCELLHTFEGHTDWVWSVWGVLLEIGAQGEAASLWQPATSQPPWFVERDAQVASGGIMEGPRREAAASGRYRLDSVDHVGRFA
jgi:WD40 repeat protein